MRELPFGLSIIGLACGCASAPDPNAGGDRELLEASATASFNKPSPPLVSSATALVVPDPVSLAKAAIEEGPEDERKWTSFAWGRLSFASPIDWRQLGITEGVLLLPPGTGTASIAALFVGASQPDALLALERALPISHCKWLPEQTGTVGRAKLEAQIVDGACRREDQPVSIARVRYANANVAFFMWDKGADPAPLWQIARAVDNLSPQRLMPCCTALRQNAKSAPPTQIDRYQQAADICTLDRAGANPDTLAKVRAALMGAGVPAACR